MAFPGIARRLMLVVVILAASGCTAANMEGLETRYQALVEQSNRPGPAIGVKVELNKVAGGLAQAGIHDDFYLLGQHAMAMVEKAKDPLTKIALLRLAALSGWLSERPSGIALATEAAAAGRRNCEALKPDQYYPKRDCAIARILPTLLTSQELYGRVQTMPLDDPMPAAVTDTRLQLGREAVDLFGRVRGLNAQIGSEITGNLALEQWYRETRRVYTCAIAVVLATPVQPAEAGRLPEVLAQADRVRSAAETALEGGPGSLDVRCRPAGGL
jgi:hypothetical protein